MAQHGIKIYIIHFCLYRIMRFDNYFSILFLFQIFQESPATVNQHRLYRAAVQVLPVQTRLMAKVTIKADERLFLLNWNQNYIPTILPTRPLYCAAQYAMNVWKILISSSVLPLETINFVSRAVKISLRNKVPTMKSIAPLVNDAR